MSVSSDKSARSAVRIDLSATLHQDTLIRRAAEATRKSVAEFVLDSACRAAENALLDHRLFLLDDANWQKFQEAIDQPARVRPRLQKLMREKSPWE
ncbi:DUF1778 domain-containing protein [Desulfobacterales bacterium HSG2]|nr:DUF1778 domain-containing protein [Desulfobacterales bacterium HSG2]